MHGLGLPPRRRADGGDGDDRTFAEPPDPTTPNAGERWPADAPLTRGRTMRCWGGWSWTGSCRRRVLRQLVAALTVWEPLMGGELFPVEPLAELGVPTLLTCSRRSGGAAPSRLACPACWHDRVALVEVCGRLGLALLDLRGRRGGLNRRPGVGRPLLCQRVLGCPRLGVGAGR